jgi:hypothetical protein
MKKAKGIAEMLKWFFKPLMNERGVIGDQGGDDGADDTPIIPGTTYKTIEDVAKALTEKDQLINKHGNELGSLRNEKATLLQTVEKLSKQEKAATPAKTDAPDYDTEISSVRDQIAKLDTMDDKFSEKQAKLISTLTELTAKATHERTLNAAGELMKKELSTRDQKAALEKFYADNPTFKTPETQAEIDEFLANDRSGMHDKFSAYFKIKADKALAEVAERDAKNAEMQRALDLTKGKNETGKVIVKGQSPQTVTKQPTNLSGAERDAAMLEALKASRGT